MQKQASQVALARTRHLSELEKQVCDIAESPLFQAEWNRVAALARSVPGVPVVLRACMDRPAASHALWRTAPLFAFYEDIAIMAAVELEAKHPRYLELPPVLSSLAQHPLFQSSRALGRCQYRDLMYFEDEETGQEVYEPVRYSQQEVFDYVDGCIRPADRRMAVAVALPARVGRVVGFLSGLAVVQPDEARNGMAILAALVVPLLGEMVPGRLAPRGAARTRSLSAPRKQRKGVQHG